MSLPNFWRVDEWVKSIQGLAISGAHVYVLLQPTSSIPTSEQLGPPAPLATLYTDSTGGTQLPQPVQTDSFGHVDAYVAPGLYTVAIYNNGTLQQTYADQNIGAAGLTNGGGLIAGTAISIMGSVISGAYVAGTGISIVDGVIINTAAGATYTAGLGIAISGANVISNTAQGASFSSSGKGWFMADGNTSEMPVVNGFNAALTNRSANVVVVAQFALGESWTLSKVSYALQGVQAASNFNFGIYDKNGNKLIDSGAFDGSITTPQTNSFTPVTLPADVYYFAVSETTGGSLTGPVMQLSASIVTKWLSYFNATTTFVGTATNTTSGNVMPATLGALTPASAAWFQGLPLCVWQV